MPICLNIAYQILYLEDNHTGSLAQWTGQHVTELAAESPASKRIVFL